MHAFIFLYYRDHDSVANDWQEDDEEQGGRLNPFFSTGEDTEATWRSGTSNCCDVWTCGIVRHDLGTFQLANGIMNRNLRMVFHQNRVVSLVKKYTKLLNLVLSLSALKESIGNEDVCLQ